MEIVFIFGGTLQKLFGRQRKGPFSVGTETKLQVPFFKVDYTKLLENKKGTAILSEESVAVIEDGLKNTQADLGNLSSVASLSPLVVFLQLS